MGPVSREEGELLSNRSGISSTYISLVKADYPCPCSLSLPLSRSCTSLFLSFGMFGVTAAVLKIGVRWFSNNVHRCFCIATITRACARINRATIVILNKPDFSIHKGRCSQGTLQTRMMNCTIGKSVLIRAHCRLLFFRCCLPRNRRESTMLDAIKYRRVRNKEEEDLVNF